MPAFTESTQRFGSADGLWRDPNLNGVPNDGVDGSIEHRQVIVEPVAANSTGIASGLAVNLQPGDELEIPLVLGQPVTMDYPRQLVITFTPATTSIFQDNFTWFGVDGYGRTDAVIQPNTLLGAIGIVSSTAYVSLTKIRWNGPNPYVGALDIGWTNAFGLRFVLGTPEDMLSEQFQGSPNAVPAPVASSQLGGVNYGTPGGRGTWEPLSTLPNGARTYFLRYRPIKVNEVTTVNVQELSPFPLGQAKFASDIRNEN